MEKYYFGEKNEFIIENYNRAKTFSSFLPGIAGIYGIPMWTYYVNRGQCVSSFGIQNKNGEISEFYPANKAYQETPLKGFRTFIKIGDEILEPFSMKDSKFGNETLKIKRNEIELKFISEKFGLEIEVLYFNIPNESFAALARQVKVKNVGSKKINFEILDGLPELLPYGINYEDYKGMSNTLRAWMDVKNLENNIPFYAVRGGLGDSAKVELETKGNFYLNFLENEDKSIEILKPIVDMELIFGNNSTLIYPDRFQENKLEDLLKENQITVNKISGGFCGSDIEIGAGKSIVLSSIIGHINDIEIINNRKEEIANIDYFNKKRVEAEETVELLLKDINTKTGNKKFDEYVKQNYLDNLLRGGYPILMGNEFDPMVYHIFSRKHGDLERDYNFFSLEAGYYSQGNGNFRDVNQNRRSDIFFNPKINDFNVKQFMSLTQLDGYNPLVVKGSSFLMKKSKVDEAIKYVEEGKEILKDFLKKSYTPGEYYKIIGSKNIKLNISEEDFLKKILVDSEQNFEAEFGEGFWTDHWVYDMDLIESYLDIYPDKKEEFLFQRKEYTYFDNIAKVVPRKDKYVYDNGKIRQYNAVEEENEKKAEIFEKRENFKNWVRVKNGLGEIYKTNLYEKLLSLALNKFVTMDSLGIGIEMEAGKPGWNDSLNGLPGLFGSSISETLELKRLMEFIKIGTENKLGNAELPREILELLEGAYDLTKKYYENKITDYVYWDDISNLRESYREKIYFGISGQLVKIEYVKLLEILSLFEKKIDLGIKKAFELGDGICPTYLYYEAEKYEFLLDENGKQKLNAHEEINVKVTEFSVHKIPYYLEGPAKAMKILKNRKEKDNLFESVKKSDVYDKKLKMYKISESIANESYEIGRAKSFTAGWLENEAVFLHMEYKWLLSLLSSGLYDKFYSTMKDIMIPFLKPEIYGRSIIENSSFIASSANPNEKLHGQGFVARLSGATAEFLNIYRVMMSGKSPFKYLDDELVLEFNPILSKEMFDENNKVEFTFLGKCKVIYHNENRKDTYGDSSAQIEEITFEYNNEKIKINNFVIEDKYAKLIRNGVIREINIKMV